MAHGPIPACLLFFYCLLHMNDFHILKWWKSKFREKPFVMWKLHEIQISVLTNKVLLEHSHTHSLIYCLWLISHHKSRVSVTEAVQAAKPKIVTICPDWKSLPNLVAENLHLLFILIQWYLPLTIQCLSYLSTLYPTGIM